MNIGIVGPAGSGKGTQAVAIAKRYNLVHLVVGDALRDEIKTGSKLGQEIAKHINFGSAAPSKVVVDVVKKQMEKNKGKDFLLDSAPYNLDQVSAFSKVIEIDALLLLDFSDPSIVFERLAKRRHCPSCHLTTSTVENPSEICPVCGTALEVRPDDSREIIEWRLKNFETNIRPVTKHFDKLGKLIKVSADGTIEEVWQSITKALDAFFAKKNVIG